MNELAILFWKSRDFYLEMEKEESIKSESTSKYDFHIPYRRENAIVADEEKEEYIFHFLL